jgi:hypothetical protein
MSSKNRYLMILIALLLGGCALAEPDYVFPEAPISPRWHGANPLSRL